MDKQTFIDKIKLLFSETEEVKAAEDEPEVAVPDKEECKCEEGDEDCKCDEPKEDVVIEAELLEEPKKEVVVKAEMSEESEDVDPLEARFLALETSLANISESMSAIDSLSKAVSDLANSPSEGEIKLSKANSKGVKKVSAREERVIAFSKRSK